MTHYHVLIIGDGNAAVTTAEHLLEKKKGLQVGILESGEDILTETPQNVKWIKEAVAFFQPFRNKLITDKGNQFSYDYLIIQSLSRRSLSFIRQSLLVDKNGAVDIHKKTFQHKKYHNIFAFTDSINISGDRIGYETENRVLVKDTIALSAQNSAKEKVQEHQIENINFILSELKYFDLVMKTFLSCNEASMESLTLWKKQNLPWFYYHKMNKGSA